MRRGAKLILAMMMTTVMTGKATVVPEPLKPGDKIAILAPASPVAWSKVEGAAKVIEQLGYEPVIYPSVKLHDGQFSGTPAQRLADLKDAFANPEIRAILCARGGYGMVHNLDSLAKLHLENDPKWVIGFSDISAFHALMASKGIASIHASMVHHIQRGMEEPENEVLFEILQGEFPTYEFEPDRRNHHGHAEGKLLGGNLSVIQALIGTPYNVIEPGTILFIEDVAEEIYKYERIMYQLKLMGILDNLKGLIIGQFTETRRGENYKTVEEMLEKVLKDYPELPVVFNAPIGHVRHNVPMIESVEVVLDVTPEAVVLEFKN